MKSSRVAALDNNHSDSESDSDDGDQYFCKSHSSASDSTDDDHVQPSEKVLSLEVQEPLGDQVNFGDSSGKDNDKLRYIQNKNPGMNKVHSKDDSREVKVKKESSNKNKSKSNQKKNANISNTNQQNNRTRYDTAHKMKDKGGSNQQDPSKKCNRAKMVEEGDMFTVTKSILSYFLRRGENHSEIVDNFVLRIHYSLGVCIFILAFLIVQANWFANESIHCVFGNNADKTVTPALQNSCLSYPYTCEPSQLTVYDGEDCPRRYVMFYRWIHFSFLIMAGLYYTPRMLAKRAGYSPLRRLLADLVSLKDRYDDFAFKDGVAKMVQYFENHYSIHSSLYTRLILCHAIVLTVDITAFIYFEFFMQNFIGLMYRSYPFHRSPGNFSDNLYQMFPPFVFCTIDEYNLINNARKDILHCHLLLMELYEKIFVVLWVWMAFVMVCAIISLIFLLLFSLPWFNYIFLFTFTTSKTIKKIKKRVHKRFGYGDLYVMYLTKCHVSEGQFIMFLSQILENCPGIAEGILSSGKGDLTRGNAITGNNPEASLWIPGIVGWHVNNQSRPTGHQPLGGLKPDTFINLPSNSLLPDSYSQSSSRVQSHKSSTPKPKSRCHPLFLEKEKPADLYPISEISP